MKSKVNVTFFHQEGNSTRDVPSWRKDDLQDGEQELTRSAIPFFSIIIAAYNAEEYLPRTLEAIRRQTWADFEVIIVNDGSVDRTGLLADACAQRDPRFRAVHTVNRGISPSRNLAVQLARAEWIAVCDADDTWHETKLERQADFIRAWSATRDENLLAVGTFGYMINGADHIVRTLEFAENPWPDYLREDAPVGQFVMINSSVVFRRDAFEAVGRYHGDYTPTEDTDLWVRLSERGAVVNMPEHLTYYRIHGNNVSAHSYTRMLLNTHRVLHNARRRARGEREWTYEEFLDELRADPHRYAHTMRTLRHLAYYTRGKNAWTDGRPLMALKHLLEAALVAPIQTLRLMRASRAFRQWRTRVTPSRGASI